MVGISERREEPFLFTSQPIFVRNNAKVIPLSVAGCVTYSYPISTVLHRALFVFRTRFTEELPSDVKNPAVLGWMLGESKLWPKVAAYVVVETNVRREEIQLVADASGFNAN
jgi:hypothetical protein